jgi:hypothetical protein
VHATVAGTSSATSVLLLRPVRNYIQLHQHITPGVVGEAGNLGDLGDLGSGTRASLRDWARAGILLIIPGILSILSSLVLARADTRAAYLIYLIVSARDLQGSWSGLTGPRHTHTQALQLTSPPRTPGSQATASREIPSLKRPSNSARL